jgi:dipeptidyl aminopeptidase/acylaminoacyl peptidase
VQLSHEVGPYHAPTVSPDGKMIAYLGYVDRHVANQNVHVTVMDPDGSHPRVIAPGFDRSIMAAHWAADSRSLYIQYVDEAITKVARMSLDGRIEPVADHLADGEGPVQLPYTGGEFAVAEEGTVAYVGGHPDHLPEIFITRNGKSRRLTKSQYRPPGRTQRSDSLRPLPVKSSVDGRPISAWELLPPNFDPKKKYPLILEIHGGPYLSYGPVFSSEYQLYAAAGYIVVYGNPRGSNSYGEEFADLIYNNYPSDDYDDLMSIVDAAIARGNVDTDNLFVTGSSGGGVLTSWIVGKTHRFRAAVTAAPRHQLDQLDAHRRHGLVRRALLVPQAAMGGPGDLLELSPLSLVGNVTTPTMVLVGLSDLRTTVSEAEQYYQALQLRRHSDGTSMRSPAPRMSRSDPRNWRRHNPPSSSGSIGIAPTGALDA